MNIKYYMLIFLLLIIILITTSRNDREYFSLMNNGIITKAKKMLQTKGDIIPPWKWFDPNKNSISDLLSNKFSKSYLPNLNNHIDKIVDVCVAKTLKLSTNATTKSIHNLIPVGCLLSRFILSYIKKKETYIVIYLVTKIGYAPGIICSQKIKHIAYYIYQMLQLGLTFPMNNIENCPCDYQAEDSISPRINIDWIMKIICFPIQTSTKSKTYLYYIYNLCILILSIYYINIKKKYDLVKLGIYIKNPILYFQIIYELITSSFVEEIGTTKRDDMFSHYLKNVPVKEWLDNINIDKLSTFLISSGIPFIQDHINEIKKFPNKLYDTIKSKLLTCTETDTDYKETFMVSNYLPKTNYSDNDNYTPVFSSYNNNDFISRDSKSDCSADINIFTESEYRNMHGFTSVDFKKDFMTNKFNFNYKSDSENETNFVKHMYFYSQYLHHLDKQEFISLINNEFKSLNLKCQDKDDLWKLYSDSLSLIDGKDKLDKYIP